LTCSLLQYPTDELRVQAIHLLTRRIQTASWCPRSAALRAIFSSISPSPLHASWIGDIRNQTVAPSRGRRVNRIATRAAPSGGRNRITRSNYRVDGEIRRYRPKQSRSTSRKGIMRIPCTPVGLRY